MIVRVALQRADETVREGVFALHRVGERWEPIDDIAYETADAAVARCVEDACSLLDGLVGLVLEGYAENLAVVQGLEVVHEGLRRLWDEPGEEDRVELPQG